MKLFFLCLFSDVSATEWTTSIGEQRLEETFCAKYMVAVGLHWAIICVKTDGAFVVILLFALLFRLLLFQGFFSHIDYALGRFLLV